MIIDLINLKYILCGLCELSKSSVLKNKNSVLIFKTEAKNGNNL